LPRQIRQRVIEITIQGLKGSLAVSPVGLPVLDITGKGKKRRMVACPERLTEKLQAYAYKHNLGPDDKFFSVNRQRAWQIIKDASKRAGLNKRTYPYFKTLRCHREIKANGKSKGPPTSFRPHKSPDGNEIPFYLDPRRFFTDPATG